MSEKPPVVAEPVPDGEDPRRQRALPPPAGEQAKDGEHIPFGEGPNDIDEPHTTGLAYDVARGARVRDINLSEVNEEWVLRRLVAEATDFGTRTRQSSRLKALELIGTHFGMFGADKGEGEDVPEMQKIRNLPRAQRLERIAQLMQQVGRKH